MEDTQNKDSQKISHKLDLERAPELTGLGIQSCCRHTIEKLVTNNPMMVCPECKQLIKCYQDEKQFLNYVKFCGSRNRPVTTGKVLGFYTVVFNSY